MKSSDIKRKAVATYIVDWLSKYLRDQTQCNGFVVGVSGGVDSAVVSTLCAYTELPTTLVTLPASRQTPISVSVNHCQWLMDMFNGVEHINIDMNTTIDALTVAVSRNVPMTPLGLANTVARLRMTTLYSIASSKNALVVGTGNLVEDFGVGFFTKWGDGGVDISPIGNLFKSDVYALAEEFGIHSDIINAPPTDGLWEDGRTDEQQLGISYEDLETAMKLLSRYTLGQIINGDFTVRDKNAVLKYNTHRMRNMHKMKPIPVCIIPEEVKGVK